MLVKNQAIRYEVNKKTVMDLANLYERGKLILSPAFQRRSVWKPADQKKLIESIMRGYPVPALVLHKRNDENIGVIFDVIDGKQRLEAIFCFMGTIPRKRFFAHVEIMDAITGETTVANMDWKAMQKRAMQDQINQFAFPVIEVEGAQSEVLDLFVILNSTGKPLKPQEKLHARNYNSEFLKEAARLAKKYETYFISEMQVLSADQVSRMKHIELVSELMLSLLDGRVLPKKNALNRALGKFDNRQLSKASKLTESALKRVKLLFPDLRQTRFSKLTDFYTLVVLVGEFQQRGLILTDRRRNKLARELLQSFGASVDEISELKRSFKGIRPEQDLYHKYWLTVRESTDEFNQRKQRQDILEGVLKSLFDAKDDNRYFSEEQRRILWNTSKNRECTMAGCKTKLTWDDFTIDHIDPHSKGGRTELENAAIMCRIHNSAKGNRIAPRKKVGSPRISTRPRN